MKSSVKRVLLTLASLIVVSLLFTVTAYAEDYGNFYYERVSPEGEQTFEAYIEITGYKNTDDENDTVVNLPSEIEDIPVTRIAASAFYGKDKITDVIIPDSVTIISNAAFYNCTALKTVIIPDSVTYIGESAFQGCEAIENVIIGNGVKTIGDIAFKGCKSLANLDLGSSVETVGSGAFFGCDALNGIYVPDCVKTIGSFAFGFVQNGDEAAPINGFAFITNNSEAVREYNDRYAKTDDTTTLHSAFVITDGITPCGEESHKVSYANVRKATDAYVGLDLGKCDTCKKLVTRANTEISQKEDDKSAVTTLILVLIILLVLVVLAVIYIRKSKARRNASIAAYKDGRPMPDADEKAKEEAKKLEKEEKKKAKQLAKLRSYGIIKDDNDK